MTHTTPRPGAPDGLPPDLPTDLPPDLPPARLLPVRRLGAARRGGVAAADAPAAAHPAPAAASEPVAEEVPVAMVYNGISHAVMLASPGDLEDFALGFSLSEGIIDRPDDLLDAEAESAVLPGGRAGVSLQLRVTLRCFMRLKERRRSLAGRTGCGLCGTEELAQAVRPVRSLPPEVQASRFAAAALLQGLAALDAAQPLQRATGASHAAGWFDRAGRLRLVREDVGRHNALDKLLGAAARAQLDPAQAFVAVTSRASYEMVYKTAQAGVGLLAAVSAPTALAVHTAEAAGLVLAGFVREGRLTLYSGTERVDADV